MFRRTFMIAAAALALMAGAAPQPARADQSAIDFLKPYTDWARLHQEGTDGMYFLKVVMVSNQPTQVASYVETRLPFYSRLAWKGNLLQYVYGFGQVHNEQLFNDRRWVHAGDLFNHPFDPYHADDLGMELQQDMGRLKMTLNSWGGGVYYADLKASNGLLIGTLGGTQTSVLISVKKQFIPTPK